MDDDVVPDLLGDRRQETVAAHRRPVRPEASRIVPVLAVVALIVPELQAEVGAAAVGALELHDQVVRPGAAVDHRLDVEGKAKEVFVALAEAHLFGETAGAVATEDQLRAVLFAGQLDGARLGAVADDVLYPAPHRFADAGGAPAVEAVLEVGLDDRLRRIGGRLGRLRGRRRRLRRGRRRRRRRCWPGVRVGIGSGRRRLGDRRRLRGGDGQGDLGDRARRGFRRRVRERHIDEALLSDRGRTPDVGQVTVPDADPPARRRTLAEAGVEAGRDPQRRCHRARSGRIGADQRPPRCQGDGNGQDEDRESPETTAGDWL